MNRCIEIHDSRLSGITREADGVHIRFEHAYIHQSEGEPARDAGTGWSQKLDVVVRDGVIEGDVPSMPCDLADGSLVVGDRRLENIVPLPCDFSGPVELWLEGYSDADYGKFCVKGSGVRVVEFGSARFIEEVDV